MKKEKGEYVLLGFFGVFVAAFLIDIRKLPLEGKLLPYILAPFILVMLIASFASSPRPSRRRKTSDGLEGSAPFSGEKDRGGQEEMDDAEKETGRIAKNRFYNTLISGAILFLSIYFFGFYVGSGVMLLLWFISLRRVSLRTLIMTVSAPIVLYVPFELLLDVGLPKGALFKWLGY